MLKVLARGWRVLAARGILMVQSDVLLQPLLPVL